MPRSNEGNVYKKNAVLMPDVEGLQCQQGGEGDGEVTLHVYTPKEVTSHTG